MISKPLEREVNLKEGRFESVLEFHNGTDALKKEPESLRS